jgi:putative transposase
MSIRIDRTKLFRNPTSFMGGSRKAVGETMKQQMSVIGKIVGLTNIKEAILSQEYDRFNNICQQVQQCRNNDIEPKYIWFKNKNTHACYSSDAIRIIKEPFVNLNEQPLYLRNDLFRIEKQPTKEFKYWLKVPTKQRRQFWVALKFAPNKENLLDNYKMCDSKITKRQGEWFAHITIEKEVMLKTNYTDILGIDLGDRRTASVVRLSDGIPEYYGKEIRQIKGHYFYLRKQLNKKTIRKISNTERRRVKDQLHKISRDIVNQAIKTNSLIVLGDLKNIRKGGRKKKNNSKYKGKKFNRKINTMPFYKLSQFIEYKAHWEGVMVIKVNEAYTSQTCSKCGQLGARTNGLFKCSCGYQDNADRNGAINIAYRGLGQASKSGASVIMPRTVGRPL